MSILKLSEDSPDSKRAEHAKTASVSFGEVYVQGTNGTGSDADLNMDITPLGSPNRDRGKNHAHVLIPPEEKEYGHTGLESRDNPFVPGSDLCKEADEILQKATIIRDRFILQVDTDGTTEQEVTSETKSPLNSQENGKDCSVAEELILPQTTTSVNTAPETKAKQNGKIDDSAVSPTSVKPEVGSDQTDGLAVIDDNKDKKKQKKCCSVM